MAIPDYQSLMLPVLKVSLKGETSVPAAEAEIASMFSLTQGDLEKMLPSGKQRVLHNRIHWAKFYLTKAGLIKSPKRGRFVITESGKDVLANPPVRIDNKFLLSFAPFREFYRVDSDSTVIEVDDASSQRFSTPEEVIEQAFNETQSVLRSELLERILQNGPMFFESLIVDLLVAMGYGGSHKSAAAQLGRTGDGGVDGIINEDVLGLDRVYVQAKRYAPGTTIGRPDVQAFTGSLVGLGASKGVFVTTSTFSSQAVDFAARIPQRVILIDGGRLTNLMIEYGVGVRSSRILEFKRIDEDFFVEE